MNHRPTDGGILGYLRVKRLPTPRRQFFRVVQARQQNVQRHNHRRTNDGTRQWPAASLVDPRDGKNSRVAERKLVLKRARHFQSRAVDLILDGRGRFALAQAKVVQLRTANGTLALNLNLRDAGRVDWENTLHAFAIGNAANGEILVDARALAANHNAGINLDTLLVALNHAGVDFDRIANIEGLQVGLELLGFDIR